MTDDPLDKVTTLIATAMLAENDNEALAALRGARAKAARGGVDIHNLRLLDDRNRNEDRGASLSYNSYTARLRRAEASAAQWQREAEANDRRATAIALNSVRALRAEQDRVVKLKARIAALSANRRKTVAQVRNTTEWVTQTEYTPDEAQAAFADLDKAVSDGRLTRPRAIKFKAHIARRTL